MNKLLEIGGIILLTRAAKDYRDLHGGNSGVRRRSGRRVQMIGEIRARVPIGKGTYCDELVGITCDLIIKDGIQGADLTDQSGDMIVLGGKVGEYVELLIHRRRKGDKEIR